MAVPRLHPLSIRKPDSSSGPSKTYPSSYAPQCSGMVPLPPGTHVRTKKSSNSLGPILLIASLLSVTYRVLVGLALPTPESPLPHISTTGESLYGFSHSYGKGLLRDCLCFHHPLESCRGHPSNGVGSGHPRALQCSQRFRMKLTLLPLIT